MFDCPSFLLLLPNLLRVLLLSHCHVTAHLLLLKKEEKEEEVVVVEEERLYLRFKRKYFLVW